MANTDTSLEDCISEGEKITFDFFKNKLPKDYCFWNNLEINYRNKYSGDRESAEIDALLYNDELGLYIFSVKDWRINQIDRIENNFFYRNNHAEPDRPFSDLKKQFNFIMQFLESKNELSDSLKRLKFPINYSIIFPYISKIEFENKIREASSYITEKSSAGSYLWMDLLKNERILKDKFVAKNIFDNLRNVRFTPCLTGAERDYLFSLLSSFRGGSTEKEKIYQPINLNNKAAEEKTGYVVAESLDTEDDIFVSIEDILIRLDKEQIKIANSYLNQLLKTPGHLILKGSAGSGKTIIFLQMYYKLANLNDKNYRIAYISRQHSLANDFKEKLAKRGITAEHLNNSGSFIGVFHEFFQIFFKDEYQRLEKDKNNYPKDNAISSFIEKNIDRVPELFDFILIDEGHNLPDVWINFIVNSVKGNIKGRIVYAEDQEQNIYGLKRNFKAAGLDEKLTLFLKINYRNTYEIYHFAQKFCNKSGSKGVEGRNIKSTGDNTCDYSVNNVETDASKKTNRLLEVRLGRIPELVSLKNLKNKTKAGNIFNRIFLNTTRRKKSNVVGIAKVVFKRFENWLNEGFLPGEIALIYPVSKIMKIDNNKNEYKKNKNDKLVGNIILYSLFDIFKNNGFLFKHTYSQGRITDKFPKRFENLILSYDSDPSYKEINLVTAMSSQGLSYKCVILVLDGFESITWFGRQEITNMIYTSVTRATHELMLVSMDENEFSRKAASILNTIADL